MQPKKPTEPVIVKKKRVAHGEEDEDHGAWKIAYADFTTAMMALFIVLWLISITSEEKREQLADFFNPVSVSRSHSGSDGVLFGRVVDQEGALSAAATQGSTEAMTDPRLAVLEERLKVLARQSTARDEGRPRLADHMSVQETTDGIAITLFDRADFSMFDLGSAVPRPAAVAFIQDVSQTLLDLDGQIVLAGHTDAHVFASAARQSNWTLSFDRADAVRRTMVSTGIPAERILRIVGHAARQPLVPDAPFDPRNRRVEFFLPRPSETTVAPPPTLLPEGL